MCDEELYCLYVTKYGYSNQIKEYDVETETEMCLGFWEKSKAKRNFARPRRRWENIKMECKGTGCEGVV